MFVVRSLLVLAGVVMPLATAAAAPSGAAPASEYPLRAYLPGDFGTARSLVPVRPRPGAGPGYVTRVITNLDAEAEQRWGDSPAYKESMRRTKSYSKEDWKRFKAESEEGAKQWIEVKASGAAPDSAKAMQLAEAARLQIDKWFYPCPPEMHRNLATLYESDPRFGDNFEKMAPGMAAYVVAAIRANAERAEKAAKK